MAIDAGAVRILLRLNHDTRVTLHVVVFDIAIEAGDTGRGLLRKL